MSLSLSIQDRGQEAPRNGAQNTLCILGVCSAGTANVPVSLSRGQDAPGALGYGPLTELGEYVIDTSKIEQILCKITGSIAGTKTVVAQSGSGPLPTLSGTPYDTMHPKLKIVTAGILGAAQFALALDGATYGPTFDIPAKKTAQIQGTVDLTTITLADLDTLTFIGTSDSGTDTATLTTPADLTALLSQLNTAFSGEATFSLVSGRYLLMQSITAASTGTLSIGAGTANTLLGFTSSATATGANSTYAIPNTGITVTFIAGTYVLGEVYSWSTTAPRFTTTDLSAALAAMRASGLEWTDVVLVYEPIDAADLLVMASALDAGVTAWQSGNPRIHSTWIIAAPLSATPGSTSSDQTNDTAVKNALASFTALGAVVDGDTYISGREVSGLFRRPLLWGIAARMAAYRLSSDVGNGEQPALEGCSAVGPDGATLARDEDTALVKMKPQRFITAHRWRGGVYAVRGVSRANSSSKFRHFGILRMTMLAARIAWESLKPYDNADRDLNPDGTLQDADATAIEEAITTKMTSGLIDSPTPGAAHASALLVTVNRTENVGVTNDTAIDFQVQHKGQFETVSGSLGIVSTLTLGGG